MDIDTSLSILLMPLVTGIDPAISLLTFLVGIHRHVRLMGVGYRWLGVVTNTFIASILLGNWWWSAVHHLLLSLPCQKLWTIYLGRLAAFVVMAKPLPARNVPRMSAVRGHKHMISI
ncbi:hypothetical protein JJQ51_24605 [Rhizobium sp. AG207R]|nr:hypothetical protein [Rhizobium sp. AG207R]